jgi:hypothetical protein
MELAVKAGLEVAQQGVDPTELRQIIGVLPAGDNGLGTYQERSPLGVLI